MCNRKAFKWWKKVTSSAFWLMDVLHELTKSSDSVFLKSTQTSRPDGYAVITCGRGLAQKRVRRLHRGYHGTSGGICDGGRVVSVLCLSAAISLQCLWLWEDGLNSKDSKYDWIISNPTDFSDSHTQWHSHKGSCETGSKHTSLLWASSLAF